MEEKYKNMTVLLVDDEEDIREIIRDLLSEHVEVNIMEAENGVKALEVIEKNTIDLAIIDIMMPEMDGMELLERIHEDNPELICIMLTAHGNKVEVTKAVNSTAFAFLEKPFDNDMLVDIVKNGLKMRYFQGYMDASMQDLFEQEDSDKKKK